MRQRNFDGDNTEYGEHHFTTYAQLVTAHDSGTPWRVGAREILDLDVERNEVAAHRCYSWHMDRALWIAGEGYQQLLVEAGLRKAN